jgi:outer membrane protein OmpA-like peptidoglycan-associated protein
MLDHYQRKRHPAMIFRRLLRISALATLLSISGTWGVFGQDIEDDIKQVEQQLEDARSSQIDLVSPRHFSEAEKRLKEAKDRYGRGGKIEDIRKRLSEVRTELSSAMKYEEVGKVLPRTAIEARNAAAEAGAPEFAATEWQNAEKIMREAGERVEKGDQNGTRDRALGAEQTYRAAELVAIRADVLGKARASRSSAMQGEAQKWAATTFADAEALLRQAERELTENRYDRSEARTLAQRAQSQFARSGRIARTAQQVDDDAKKRVEALILEQEALVGRVAESLHRAPDFADGIEPVTDEVVSAVGSLYDDRSNLQEELSRKNVEIDHLRNVEMKRLKELVDSLDTRLAMLEQRERAVTAELRESDEQEDKIQRVNSAFATDEAQVLISGDRMILRLYGLTFASGSAEIRPGNFTLLTKVQRVLREFPNSPMIVSGHTDSRGNDATNLSLSQRRADAVREYLLANMSIDEGRITAVGFGESRPIASNDNAQGQAKNRRIDIIVSMSGEPMSGM